MTDEEKAKKIAAKYARVYKCYDDANDKDGVCYFAKSGNECESSALEMAKWKEREVKRRIFDEVPPASVIDKFNTLISKACLVLMTEKKVHKVDSARFIRKFVKEHWND